MKKNVLYIIGVLAAVLLTACEHKELCYKHPHTAMVRVAFDWTNAPEANPEGMCVFFYPVGDPDRSTPQRVDFTGKAGGEVEIQVGSYCVLCYNNDTEAVLFRGMDEFQQHEAYTREGNVLESIYGNGANFVPKAEDAADERVTISPDMLWGCYELDVTVSEAENQVITLYPEEQVCTYTYEIRNVQNLKYASQMCGSLSGMAPSVFFGTEELGKECITVPFESVSDGKSTVTGRFYTFGHHEDNAQPHKFLLYVWMKDDGKYYYTFDVTEQVHTAPDKRHVHIIIDDVELPQPITNGSGFEPTVDDWVVVEEDIIM